MNKAYFYDTAIGRLLIAEDGDSITELSLVPVDMEKREGQPDLEYQIMETELLREAASQLTQYLEGKRRDFDVKLNPKGTEFQRKVWDVLRTIPYGETRSYKQIAEAVGNAKASRAVGMANHNNPIMCIIPCHRVIGANGSLVGYAGGLDIKEKLLKLEQQRERMLRMDKEWSLEILYQGFDDAKYKEDKANLQKLTKDMAVFSETLEQEKDEAAALLKAIEYMEEHQLLGTRLSYYVALRQSVNTSDSETVNEMNSIEKTLSLFSKPLAVIQKFIACIPNPEAYYEKNPKLRDYSFLIGEIRKEAKHLLSDDVEEVIAKLNISAGSAWGSMQSFLTSTLEVEYRGNLITLPEVRNKAHDEDVEVRKDAFAAELDAYEKIKDAISFSLNNIKTQVNTISELRGFESPLAMTLLQAKMKKETLDAMLEAIRESLPVFHKYLRHKARIMGHEGGLPWYELFAPIGESNTKFTTEQSKEYLVKHFSGFSKELADMVEEAFDQEWIDFYPRKGKVGGAFCENLPFVKQSRILMNFTGALNDVITLAHELGHAYHGLNIQEHLPLNVNYSMPVAETASTFNEALIMEAAIKGAEGREKIALIESQLQDVTQIICDIYSRYLFESAVFEKCKTGFLFADELKEMMLAAQKEAYGDGLNHDYLHPYMWVLKGHYYSENLSFYNFPYAFGGLFARGLYEKYKLEGEDFVPKYKALLKATTVMSVEEAAREAEINLEDPDFWRTSLKTIEALIEDFVRLA